MDEHFGLETLAVRAGTVRSQFNEHSEAMFLTSSFIFSSAAEAAARFKGEQPGPIYARFTNPTVSMMEERLAALEGAERCVAFASGMAAILATVMGLMKAGEHVVASRSIFGSTVQLFSNILGRFGIETTYVSPTNPAEWRAAVKTNTKLFFVESPSNPLTEVSDIRALSEIAHASGAWLAVDNCFCSPALQKPLVLGADIVIHSAGRLLHHRQLMLWVRWQTRIINTRNRRLRFQPMRQRQRIFRMRLHTDGKRFHPLQYHPGIKRRQCRTSSS